ncbi:MAG: response regulator transcription factor [Campylobacterota bacterium]|nr:response regulator transcription factor [Campylobacterota bacterium]
MTKILLLEDDLLFAETLLDLLDQYDVTHAPNGQVALNLSYKTKFDLYLFDINVPLIDGVTLLSELRKSDDNTPTIFLTSHKKRDMLKNAFNSGGDDYLSKPFDNDELLFRIEALLRRVKKNIPKCIELLCHDEEHKQFYYDKKELELSKKEYQLLVLFIVHIDKTVPKEMIVDELWNSSQTTSDGALRVYVNRLKQLIPDIKIENIRGVGYKLLLT